MADVAISYAANSSATITLASLGNGSARQCTEITNSSGYVDALVALRTRTGAVTASDKAVYVYAGGSLNDGTWRTDNASAADQAITLPSPENVRLIGVVNTPTTAADFYGGPWSLSAAFGGIVPERWFLVVKNGSGGTLSASATDHDLQYQPLKITVA